MENITHKTLDCGVEFACLELPARHIAAIEFRMLCGTAHEPENSLGIARLIQEMLDLGTEHYDGRALSDAFDEIGASHGGWVGREASACHCTVLPEFLDRAIELHAEFLRRPTFPDDKVKVNIDLTRQEWNALQDDAHSLADKLIGRQAYGKYLGRHSLGEPEYVNGMTRQQLVDHWKKTYHAGRMVVTVAGAVDPSAVAEMLEKYFAGFGSPEKSGRDRFDIEFQAKRVHHHKDLEQQQIGIAFPGTAMNDPQYYPQRAALAVLSGGMSSRLFTEVREKLGLVYWVSAWNEHPRGSGMIFMGASTTPDRCHETYDVLLREVERLNADLDDDELKRAVTGLVAKNETQGDITRSRCGELAEDLFHFGAPRDRAQKIAKLKAVTVDDIKQYLVDHPRKNLSVLTLGPRHMDGYELAPGGANGG